MTRVLITGGAGYIGSHMLLSLDENQHEIHVLDNLSRGFEDAVTRGTLHKIDLRDYDGLDNLFNRIKPDIILHFADFINVGESVQKPSLYYRNNIGGTATMLEIMQKHGVCKMVHSSSAAVYGIADENPITEKCRPNPINPYGRAKMIVEMMLDDAEHAYGLQHISLRYFNVAGADPEGRTCERHDPETHLIPNVLRAANGLQDTIKVFGTDYPTPDGTCLRDYIHVCDLVEAHKLAMNYLLSGGKSDIFNIGYGRGFSVKEVIDTAEKVLGKKIPVEYAERREGDPAELIADPSRIKKILGWKAEFDDLETIINHAYHAN